MITRWGIVALLVSGLQSPAMAATAGPSRTKAAGLLHAPRLAVTPMMRFAQNATERPAATPAKVPNGASVSLQMTPEGPLSVGTRVSFHVTARKAGYLLLVDVDADGRMTQIFPSPEMIAQSPEAASNFVRPGEELVVPNAAARKRGFDYVVSPPAGPAAIVAILSDRRVQILDLPDDAQRQRSQRDTITYLAGWTNELRVPDPGSGKLQSSSWSFDIKRYDIK